MIGRQQQGPSSSKERGGRRRGVVWTCGRQAHLSLCDCAALGPITGLGGLITPGTAQSGAVGPLGLEGDGKSNGPSALVLP